MGRTLLVTVSLGVMCAQACSSEDENPPLQGSGNQGAGLKGGVMPPRGGGGGQAGDDTGAGAAAGDAGSPNGFGGEVNMPGGPIVEVTSPEALASPDDGDVLVASEIDVLCEARKAETFDATEIAGVEVEVLDADGNVVETAAAAPTGNVDEYSAHVILAKVEENGRVGFRCRATDSSVPARVGSDTIESFIDHGPAIAVVTPKDDEAFALIGGVPFDFRVDPDPVADGDDGARIERVTLEVNGELIDLGDSVGGRYDFTLDLTDRTVFPDTPTGTVPVTIRAQNRREPEAVERILSYAIVIDAEGPAIEVIAPRNETVVGGQVALRFSVSDALSGVDEDSVTVELNDEEHRFDPTSWSRMGDEFVFLFDSTQAEEYSKVQATLNLFATDEVGNASEGESIILYLDNVPPTLDLDPDDVREWHPEGKGMECSAAFDPIGTRPPNDLSTFQPRIRVFRSMVWEETNSTEGQSILYFSGVDESSVYIYVQPDSSQALLVDTNDDGVCDELAVDGEGIEYLHLKAMTPAGSAPYDADGPTDPPTHGGCSYLAQPAPAFLCEDRSDMTRVIWHSMEGHPPVIYGIGELDPGPACTGTDWEYGKWAEEGWVCFASRGVDNAGNVGISPPLRICYDDVADGNTFTPDCDENAAPTCTDGCTPPPGFAPRLIRN